MVIDWHTIGQVVMYIIIFGVGMASKIIEDIIRK